MLDEFCDRLHPPCHEFLCLEEFQLLLVRFHGEDAGEKNDKGIMDAEKFRKGMKKVARRDGL